MTEPKIVIVPPEPDPKQWTASCPEIGRMLRHGGKDLTIDQRVAWMWNPGLEAEGQTGLEKVLEVIRRKK